MTDHTPGKLVFKQVTRGQGNYDINSDTGFYVAETIGGLGSEEEANARRLVACWNACDGVETELLEQYHAPFSALRAQRDELLEIAKQALALHPKWDAARAVIAKVTT